MNKIEGHISNYNGLDSWSLFLLLKINTDFMKNSVDIWVNDKLYKQAEDFIKSLSVVSDGTERAVKLAYDFLSTTKTEENYQNIL